METHPIKPVASNAGAPTPTVASSSATPRTDEAWTWDTIDGDVLAKAKEESRKLERELSSALASLAESQEKSDAEMHRVKACEHIAESEEGWQALRNECPSTAAVASLREAYDQLAASLAERTRVRDEEHKANAQVVNAYGLVSGERDAAVAELTAAKADTVRWFPMQYGPSIPWAFAELLYAGYVSQHGTEQSLERLAERGGFGWAEIECFWKLPRFRAAFNTALATTKEVQP